VILSHQDTKTMADALWRDALSYAVSGRRSLPRPTLLADGKAFGVSSASSFGGQSLDFGGNLCEEQIGRRMHAAAPLPLDPSAIHEEGGP
jgi:hypothetical protein